MAHCCSHSWWFRHPQEGLLLLVGPLCFDGPLNYCSLKINDAPQKTHGVFCLCFPGFPMDSWWRWFFEQLCREIFGQVFDRLSSGISKAGHQDRLVFFIIETLFAVTFFSEVIVRCGGFLCWVPNVLRCRQWFFSGTWYTNLLLIDTGTDL